MLVALKWPVVAKPERIGGGSLRMNGSPGHKVSKTVKTFLVG